VHREARLDGSDVALEPGASGLFHGPQLPGPPARARHYEPAAMKVPCWQTLVSVYVLCAHARLWPYRMPPWQREELQTELFLRACQGRVRWTGGLLFPLLAGIARNLAREHGREFESRRNSSELDEHSVAVPPASECVASRLEPQWVHLRRCVARLQAQEARLVLEHHLRGRSVLELARERGESAAATRSRLWRVRCKLRGSREPQLDRP
jgi:DNA-directed RNA polymerase specialized sigma24 family protein